MIINLSEVTIKNNRSERVQLSKPGTFQHEEYGEFSISLYDQERMKQLFESNVRKQIIDGKTVIPFDYRHAVDEEAAGWIDKLYIDLDKQGKQSLFGSVEWTPRAAEKIRNKEFKFVSPDIRRNYKDRETGEVYDVVLMGAALTNVPFLRDMEAVYLLSEEKQRLYLSASQMSGDNPDKTNNPIQGVKVMTIEEILAALGQVSPDDKKKIFEALAKELESIMMAENQQLSEKLKAAVDELSKAQEGLKLAEEKAAQSGEGDSELSQKLELSEKKVTKLSDQVESLIKTIAKTEREAEFNQQLSEGKVCEAQRDAYLKQDFAEFVAKAEAIKLDESGSGKNSDPDNSGVAEKIEKLAEKKMEADKELDYGAAVSLVLSENPKLSKEYNQG